MNYSDIRKYNYAEKRKIFKLNGEDMDNWLRYPYSAFKSRLYIELSVALVYLLKDTNVHPNHVTILYALAAVIGGLMLSSSSDILVVFSLLIFFLKGVLDWSDGLLARLTDRCSDEGAVLDPWGALVHSFCFLIGIGFYLFNRSHDVTYVYLMVLVISLRAVDVRTFTFLRVMNDIIDRRVAKAGGSIVSYSKSMDPRIIGSIRHNRVARFRQLVMNILDDRARSVDFVCLLILSEVIAGKLWVTPFVYWVYLLKYCLIFGGGVYLVYFKKMPSQLKDVVLGAQER